MIRGPPDAPITILTVPSLFTAIIGVIEDMGRFPGLIKLLREAGKPKWFVLLGLEKSSISQLNRIPVLEPITLEPNLVGTHWKMNSVAEHKWLLNLCRKTIFIYSEIFFIERRPNQNTLVSMQILGGRRFGCF